VNFCRGALLFLCIAFVTSGCDWFKGPTGPTGLTGQTGQTGSKGDKGDPGNPGNPGNPGLAGPSMVGSIIMFFGDPSTLPPEWKVCDGSVVSDPTSPLSGKTLPDLRNAFVRGEASATFNPLGSGPHSGGNDNLPAHSHDISGNTGPIANVPGPDSHAGYTCEDNGLGWSSNAMINVSAASSPNEGQHLHTAGTLAVGQFSFPPGANVPHYVALHYIIRIKQSSSALAAN
jgi:hypothetical protein